MCMSSLERKSMRQMQFRIWLGDFMQVSGSCFHAIIYHIYKHEIAIHSSLVAIVFVNSFVSCLWPIIIFVYRTNYSNTYVTTHSCSIANAQATLKKCELLGPMHTSWNMPDQCMILFWFYSFAHVLPLEKGSLFHSLFRTVAKIQQWIWGCIILWNLIIGLIMNLYFLRRVYSNFGARSLFFWNSR